MKKEIELASAWTNSLDHTDGALVSLNRRSKTRRTISIGTKQRMRELRALGYQVHVTMMEDEPGDRCCIVDNRSADEWIEVSESKLAQLIEKLKLLSSAEKLLAQVNASIKWSRSGER